MPGWVKALLIVAAVILVLILGVIGTGVYFWQRNKGVWMASAEEGKSFGKAADNKGCVDETVSRYKKDPGVSTLMNVSIFETACLRTSRPTPGFCDGVPKETEFTRSAQWRISQCRDIGLEKDSYCQQLFAPVQKYCAHGPASSKDANANDN